MRTTIWAAVLACGLVGTSTALGQLVTPPDGPPTPTAPVVLPPRMEKKPMGAPKGPMGGVDPLPGVSRGPQVEPLPVLAYESLVKKDMQNRLVHLKELPDVTALKVNPMLQDAEREKIRPYLDERRKAFERIVIENIDLADELATDRVEKIDFADRASNDAKWLNGAIRPFTATTAGTPKRLSMELKNRGMINDLQRRFNDKIADEYKRAYRDDVSEGHKKAEPKKEGDAKQPDDKKADARKEAPSMIALLLRTEALDEPLSVRRDLLVEASRGLGQTLPKLGLVGEASTKAQAIAKAITPKMDDDQRFAAMEKLKDALSVDQRKTLLRETVALRK